MEKLCETYCLEWGLEERIVTGGKEDCRRMRGGPIIAEFGKQEQTGR